MGCGASSGVVHNEHKARPEVSKIDVAKSAVYESPRSPAKSSPSFDENEDESEDEDTTLDGCVLQHDEKPMKRGRLGGRAFACWEQPLGTPLPSVPNAMTMKNVRKLVPKGPRPPVASTLKGYASLPVGRSNPFRF